MDSIIIDYSNDPFEEFQFPINYGDEFNSNYSGTIINSALDEGSSTNRSGTVFMTADATGTILTPMGTFDNVLRIKRVETSIDTTTITIMGFTVESVLKTTSTYYDWLQPSRKFTLFRIIYSQLEIPGSPPFPETVNAFYTISDLTSNVKNTELDRSISLHPNPVINVLNLDIDNIEDVDLIQILDLNGKVVLEKRNSFQRINTEDIRSGMYKLVVRYGNEIESTTFIKMK